MARSSSGDVDLAIPGSQDRNGQVRRGAEAEQAYTVARLDARYTQAAETNNAGAQQRRGVQIVELIGKRKRKVGAHDSIFGIAAIYGVTGESGCIAEVFEASATVLAGAIGSSHPGNAYAGAYGKIIRGCGYYFADDLMSGNYSLAAGWQLAFDYVQVGAAHSTGTHTQKDLAGLWFGRCDLGDPKRAMANILRRG